MLTTDGRQTIVVGGITVATVLLTAEVTVRFEPIVFPFTVLVTRLSELTISGVNVTSNSSFTWFPWNS